MTKLSVNLNKIALLRNSRGHDFPNLIEFARKALTAGAHGVTIHPRPDQRHATYADVRDLSRFMDSYPAAELNIEGYPDERFLEAVLAHRPDQITLVPDAPTQLTSDHGWNLKHDRGLVSAVVNRIKQAGSRASLFLDPDPEQIDLAATTGTDRIELYTAGYAAAYGTDREGAVWEEYRRAAAYAQRAGLGVNAGHDLSLHNLGRFLGISGILEVSIGHALTVEALDYGYADVVRKYLQIINAGR
jgi:pyridoxine 5-phosphate synthase